MQAMFVIELIFLAIGLLLGCAMKRYKRAGSTAISIILAAYFLSILSGMHEKLEFLKYLTPFKYFDAGDLYRSGQYGRNVPAPLGGDRRRQPGGRLLDLQQARSVHLAENSPLRRKERQGNAKKAKTWRTQTHDKR